MNIIIEEIRNVSASEPGQNEICHCEPSGEASSSGINHAIASRRRSKFERLSRQLCFSTSPRSLKFARDDVEKGALLTMIRKTVRFVIFFFLSLFLAIPSYAYLEEVDDGSTKLTASEQNTNMYRMTSKGKIALKKLKQIDEMMARGYAAGDGSAKNVQEVTQIVNEQNDAAVRAAAKQARQTARLLEDKSALQQKNNGQAVQMIISVSSLQSRDSEMAADLLQTLSRRRP